MTLLEQQRNLLNRRRACAVLACFCVSTWTSGCAAPWFSRKKDPAELEEARKKQIKDLWQSAERPKTIQEISRKVVTLLRVENVALVSDLPNTGGKVEPSSQRDRMLEIMRRKNVPNPNQFLDDTRTALVTATVIVPPAARKNDRLNVLVELSKHAEGTDLESGWLLATELVEMSVLGGQVREGFGFAMAQGQLVTQYQISGEETVTARTRAMVVGGAELMQSRTIGLAIADNYAHAVTMAAVLPAINKRFTVFDGASQVGVAKPRQENYIELTVPPRYRKDPDHFASVVQNIGVAESKEDKQARLDRCAVELLEPTTARRAAWQLEAAGKDAIPMLLDGLTSSNKEVRFYASHALAYLNDARSIPVLKELAASEPAFRAMCFNALTLVESYKASDALEELLNVPDAETRYGAMLALREHDSRSPMVQGEKVGTVGTIVEIPSTSAGLVVVGLTYKPEVVIFGSNPPVRVAEYMYVSRRLMLRTTANGRLMVSNIAPDREDRTAECTADLKSILQAIAQVGGGYGDWVNFVRVCGAEQLMPVEVSINPVPESGRKFNRDAEMGEADVAGDVSSTETEDESKSKIIQVSWLNPFSWFDDSKKD